MKASGNIILPFHDNTTNCERTNYAGDATITFDSNCCFDSLYGEGEWELKIGGCYTSRTRGEGTLLYGVN